MVGGAGLLHNCPAEAWGLKDPCCCGCPPTPRRLQEQLAASEAAAEAKWQEEVARMRAAQASLAGMGWE